MNIIKDTSNKFPIATFWGIGFSSEGGLKSCGGRRFYSEREEKKWSKTQKEAPSHAKSAKISFPPPSLNNQSPIKYDMKKEGIFIMGGKGLFIENRKKEASLHPREASFSRRERVLNLVSPMFSLTGRGFGLKKQPRVCHLFSLYRGGACNA